MNKKIILITKIVVYLLVALVLVLQLIMFSQSSQFATPTPEAINSPLMGNTFLIFLIIFGIAMLTAFIFPAIRMASNPKQAIKGLLGVVAIVALAGISYLFASNDLSAQQLEKLQITESTAVLVGAGMNLTWIVGICAIGAALFLALRGSFSK
jgi:hypothetical protein